MAANAPPPAPSVGALLDIRTALEIMKRVPELADLAAKIDRFAFRHGVSPSARVEQLFEVHGSVRQLEQRIIDLEDEVSDLEGDSRRKRDLEDEIDTRADQIRKAIRRPIRNVLALLEEIDNYAARLRAF